MTLREVKGVSLCGVCLLYCLRLFLKIRIAGKYFCRSFQQGGLVWYFSVRNFYPILCQNCSKCFNIVDEILQNKRKFWREEFGPLQNCWSKTPQIETDPIAILLFLTTSPRLTGVNAGIVWAWGRNRQRKTTAYRILIILLIIT